MEAGEIMEIFDYTGEDFKSIMKFGTWKIGLLRYSERFSKYKVLERHNKTDEAFVLLKGCATLYVENCATKMEACKVYNVKKGEWHHIVVSPDATVLVVENSDTSADNTDKKEI